MKNPIDDTLPDLDSYQKDVAVATAYFSSLYELNDSFFNSINKAYELAIKFVEKYPVDTKWGIIDDLEYEETLYAFFKLNH
jgi:hypothetical protein